MATARHIFIVEDDADYRAALVKSLAHVGHRVEAFERAAPAVAALTAAAAAGSVPEVALVDLAMPGTSGLEAIPQLRAIVPTLRIVVLSAHNSAEDLLGSLRAGAIGYLVKGAKLLDIAGAIEAAATGHSPISAEAGMHLVAHVAKESSGPAPAAAREEARDEARDEAREETRGQARDESTPRDEAPPREETSEAARRAASPKGRNAPVELTLRERDVLALLVEGHAYADIARALGIGVGTVQNHVKSIYRKLDVTSKAEAATVAARQGIVQR